MTVSEMKQTNTTTNISKENTDTCIKKNKVDNFHYSEVHGTERKTHHVQPNIDASHSD